MIVKMKKVTVLLSAKHRDSTLKKLRKFGVLHIKDVKPPVSEDIQNIETKLENLNKSLQLIGSEQEGSKKKKEKDPEKIVDRILELNQKREQSNKKLGENQEIQQWYDTWGSISKASLEDLEKAGIYIRFYMADEKAFKKIPEDKITHVARKEQKMVYFALFSESPDERLNFKEVEVPEIDFDEVKKNIQTATDEIKKIEKELADLSKHRKSIVEYKNELEKTIEFSRVKYGMGEDGEVAFLQGFCPVDRVDQLIETADKNGWGYVVQEPDDLDEVPTLIRNPKWVRMVEPLFKFMGTLPGYKEQDVSLVFLAFFSIFYAMIVGDAGYGLVFLGATIYLSKKKDVSKDFVSLMYLVSIATIIWGTISGTWFGSEAISRLPILNLFIIDKIYSFNPDSNAFIMQLTFIIGVVHLSIGHLMNAFKKMNSLTAIADIGWVLALWAVFFVANNIVLGKQLAGVTMPLLISGAVLILIFANFQKNIVKGILTKLGNLPLDIISSFSDIVSYIRLFAVGLATVIVASSFNEMAIGTGINSVVSGIIAAIILLLGHSINIALCGMSILVHGVRLNMLEFSGHVGVQWTGQPYKPFKEE